MDLIFSFNSSYLLRFVAEFHGGKDRVTGCLEDVHWAGKGFVGIETTLAGQQAVLTLFPVAVLTGAWILKASRYHTSFNFKGFYLIAYTQDCGVR